MKEQSGQSVVKVPTEIYSRVVGYFRPVQNWNSGKQQEFTERAYYDLEKVVPGCLKAETSQSNVA
jgi:hypothetical protein